MECLSTTYTKGVVVLDKLALDYIVRALDWKIKRLGENIQLYKDNLDRWGKQLESKKDLVQVAGSIGIRAEYNEAVTLELMASANAKLEHIVPNYDGYVHARESIRKEYGI